MKIAVIPARGGSKRIPGKNIKAFHGKPIIAYSIEAALNSQVFDKVIVSTDSEEIATVAIRYGAEVPFVRPDELSDDYSGTTEVVAHAIKWHLDMNMSVDLACCIYATAPLISPETIITGLKILETTNKQYAFTVARFPSSIHRAIKIENDEIEMYWPQNYNMRSQDMDEAYHDAGQIYWGRAEAFLQKEIFYTKKSAPILLPNYLVQDIDTYEDWKRAELVYQAYMSDKSTLE